MDPTATLQQILTHLDRGDVVGLDKEMAINRMKDLIEWLNNGGFLPDVVKACSTFVTIEDQHTLEGISYRGSVAQW